MGRTLDEDDKYGSEELESESSVKEWIRLLEKEIVRLKEELAKHPCLYTLHVEAPPPPPPLLSPPPPGSSAEMLFASAHAALKHIPILVEVPINPPHSTKCWEQPAVGIIPNKMLVFLNKIKTIKLCKVSSGSSPANTLFSSEPGPSGSVFLRQSGSSFIQNATSAKWLSILILRAGEKRKHAGNDLMEFQDDLCIAVKCQLLGSPDSSFASASALQSQPYQSLNIPTQAILHNQ
ncbi:hypothetical protein C0989_004613 [Termitomyces sp. Mn162]|nr:hypothetical protein C0989_004613 [Termitomyces sp. Mn162]